MGTVVKSTLVLAIDGIWRPTIPGRRPVASLLIMTCHKILELACAIVAGRENAEPFYSFVRPPQGFVGFYWTLVDHANAHDVGDFAPALKQFKNWLHEISIFSHNGRQHNFPTLRSRARRYSVDIALPAKWYDNRLADGCCWAKQGWKVDGPFVATRSLLPRSQTISKRDRSNVAVAGTHPP